MKIINKPIRLRSKVCILVYDKSLNISELKQRLQESFQIMVDNEWNYIIKSEICDDGKMLITVFLELKKRPDLYSDRLNFEFDNETIRPSIWCFSNNSYPLHSLLKLQAPFNLETDLITNINLTEIQKYVTVLKGPATSDTTGKLRTRKKSKENVHKSKKPFGNEQLNTIKRRKAEFDALLVNPNENRPILRKVNQQIINMKYYYSETITEEALNLINDCNKNYKLLSKR